MSDDFGMPAGLELALERLGEDPLPGEQSDAAVVEAALAGLHHAPVPAATVDEAPSGAAATSSGPRLGLVLGAVVAVAAAVALAWWLVPGATLSGGDDPRAGSMAPSVAQDEQAGGKAHTRAPEPARRPPRPELTPDAPLEPGCTRPREGVEVCLEGDGEVEGSLRLRQGRARVRSAAEIPGAAVTLDATLARLRAHGARFEATVSAEPAVLMVLVLEGKVTVERQGEAPRIVTPGEPLVVRAADERTPPPGGTSSPSRGTSPPKTAAGLLDHAQRLVSKGERKAALTAYRRLVERFSDSPEAKAAVVSLGRLELQQGRSQAALRHFDAYLARSAGPLVEEARYGRIRALRRLGRQEQERRSIEAFLADHPDSLYASRLRKRAQELTPR